MLRTIAGLYLRHEATPVPRPRILELARAAGVSAPAAQTAVSRLIDRGLLEPVEPATLSVTSPAMAMFARGNRRIFTPRRMEHDDRWVLVAFSLPEALRATRHQLRKHFIQLGGGLVSAGLWIFPEYLRSEVLEVLGALDARSYATLFISQTPDYPGTARQASAQWWDLDKLAKLHRAFLTTTAKLDASSTDEQAAYLGYVVLIDAWRAIPYLDPGLPDQILPNSWPGQESRERFLEISASFKDRAAEHAARLLRPAAG
ncbi:PaaX family transcriptional regulator C-terminal domain-containing protein [Glutamicibacter arilaitensis]|uniref:PaaX family transcriptional regulator n=1 Tax=Glutamicibacter arilaitensis TaxID=256701 RepID=UPI00384B8CD5